MKSLEEVIQKEIFLAIDTKCPYCKKKLGIKGVNVWFKKEDLEDVCNNIRQWIKEKCLSKKEIVSIISESTLYNLGSDAHNSLSELIETLNQKILEKFTL